MKINFYFLTFIFSLFILTICCSCNETRGVAVSSPRLSGKAERFPPGAAEKTGRNLSREEAVSARQNGLPVPEHSLQQTLDEIAELERSGSWFQGLGLTESGLRENTGDYAGAVAAAFKELAWAYGLGLIKKEEVEQGLLNVLTVKNEESVMICANAILAFINERWDDATFGLKKYFNQPDEPDGFGRWMILVCAMEKNKKSFEIDDRYSSETYKSIRARYAKFPEYWYRGARVFSGTIAAQYAENCINTSPLGPYANECRSILASCTGLKTEDGLSIKTKMEIESLISQSVNSGNPEFLNSLLPLIALPDNPYTVYAVSALRSLTSVPKFRDYFNSQAGSAKGRLAERLSYICRG